MALVRWDPFREMAGLQSSINKLFNENIRLLGAPEGALDQGLLFPVDIKDTPEAVIIKAELPGMNKDDIKVRFADNLMTISGERRKEEKEKGENYIRVERNFGAFSRSFTVNTPVKQDKVKARYREGILEITLPKEAPTMHQEIDIEVK